MTECHNCPEPDSCKQFGRHMIGRTYQIYKGVNISDVDRAKYISLWLNQKDGPKNAIKTKERCIPCEQKKKIRLYSHLSPGDTMVATMLVETLGSLGRYQIDIVGTCVNEIFKYNPHFQPWKDQGYKEPIKIDHPLIHQSHNGVSFNQAIHDHAADKLGIARLIPVCSTPRIYYHRDELINRPIADPYIIINAGWKDDGETKWYSYWQEVVDLIKINYPQYRIIQIGESWHHHPILNGVESKVGEWNGDARKLIWWTKHAVLALSPISFLMHVAGGTQTPCVCLATGYEPLTWACNYPHIKYLSRHHLTPCSPCWIREWKNCKKLLSDNKPACMDIHPNKVFSEIEEILSIKTVV